MLSLFALCSCASPSASQSESSELKAELRAMREENARLRRSLENKEPPGSALPGPSASARMGAPAEIPALTVVKLKPKAEPAPRISTAIPVVEPAPESVDEILQATRSEDEKGPPANPALLDQEFREGLNALSTGNLSGGVAKLQRFAADNPRHPKADNALYLSGVGLMGLSDYERATTVFEQVISSYPAGDAVKEAMLKLAECRARLNRRTEARALYGQLVKKYPGTAAATQAQARLASLPP